MRQLEAEIEAVLGNRTGRPCLFLPSGRVALYLAFRAWLSPGDRLLMSPLDDDVVFFTVLAAGLRPVMAPLSADDGNIDPWAVPEATWSSVAGVLTTNLYGLPDRVAELRSRCARLGIPLVEDAAHAIETEVDGRPVGALGDVAAFSLSKHVGGAGGVLAFPDEARRPELERLRDQVVERRGLRRCVLDVGRPAVKGALAGLGLDRPVRRARRALGLVEQAEREGHRMPLRPPVLTQAVAAAPDLDRFHVWVRVDRHEYRVQPRRDVVRATLAGLRHLDGDRARRVEGVAALRALAAVAPAASRGPALPLFRVPLLVHDRDGAAAELGRQGIRVQYVYDPPLDDYAGPAFAEPSPAPDVARWWASHVLPVDPLDAGRLSALPEATTALLHPAATLDGHPLRPLPS